MILSGFAVAAHSSDKLLFSITLRMPPFATIFGESAIARRTCVSAHQHFITLHTCAMQRVQNANDLQCTASRRITDWLKFVRGFVTVHVTVAALSSAVTSLSNDAFAHPYLSCELNARQRPSAFTCPDGPVIDQLKCEAG